MQGCRPSALVPRGFVVVHATSGDAGTLITARAMSRTSACPGCGRNARRVHSRYRRCLADLPMAGRSVRLVVVVRRFHGDAVLCEQRIFTERFARDVLEPWHGERPGSTKSSITSGWPWGDGRRRASPEG